MSDKQYEAALPLVLAHEGGYVNHRKDPGGATNKGVTQAVYDAYRTTKGLKVRSVKSITAAEVKEIYNTRYWKLAGCDELPAGLDYCVFDYAVNSGVGKAVKDLQRAINSFASNRIPTLAPLKVDGIAGEDTATAAKMIADVDEEGIINSLCDRRMKFLKSLKTWGDFGKGWTRRIEGDYIDVREGDKGVRDFAIMIARNDIGTPIPKKELPAAIGTKEGEAAPAKALGSQVSILKTARGAGAALAGAGVTGQVALEAAQTAKTHIDGTLIGQLALVVFVLLALGGVGLVLYKFFEDRAEKAGA